MKQKQTFKSFTPPGAKKTAPAKRPPQPPALQPQPLGPRDPADLLRDVLELMACCAARAMDAVAAGRTDQALAAAFAMQRAMRGADEVLKQAAYAARSKRAPLEMRERVRAAFRSGMAPVAEAVRRLKLCLRAAKARQDAMSAALNAAATRPSSVYVARGYSRQGRVGAVRPAETVRHALTLSV